METALFRSISTLKGVGKKRLELYRKLEIRTPYDLLYYFPRGYRDYRSPVPVEQTSLDEAAVVCVTITRKHRPIYARTGTQIFRLESEDAEGTSLDIVIFNNIYGYQALEVGQTYTMYGKITGTEFQKEIQSPVLHRASDAAIEAIYPQITGLTSAMLRTNLSACLELLAECPIETLPGEMLEEFQLMPLTDALRSIHQPETPEEVRTAKYRLAFEEMLHLQLGLRILHARNQQINTYPMSRETDMQPFFDRLPFTMTDAQLKAVQEITDGMSGEKTMNRLLQGDVGSGKTAVAAAACYFCAKNSYQCALMAPTEILAAQHFQTLSGILEPLGVEVCLLTGSLTQKQKKAVYARIAQGDVHLVVGTHAIMQKAVEYNALGLVITDEQHRFGVAQRTALAEKGGVPHKLVMSATPIPRTVALMMYGDLEVSVLDTMPNGRLPVKTYAVTGKIRERAMRFLTGELEQGRQAYIICPAIDDSGNDLRAVNAYAEEMCGTLLKNWRVGVLHGQMLPAEKDEAMQKFHDHETDVLISTTVVEVGVDVPNATVILIEDADRFGLSQLHQLRGRVGRGKHQSHCILVTEHVTEESKKRLCLLSETTDGFRIAEADYALRGPGEFFGSMQHGMPALKLAELTDAEMMQTVQRAVNQILEKDPLLSTPKFRTLYHEILRLFAENGENELN